MAQSGDGMSRFAAFPYTSPDKHPQTHADASGPLSDALAAAVPLRIHMLVERGGPTSWEWSETKEFADVLGEKGDVLLFRGGEKGEAAQLFNRLAKAIAVLSFMPGGISTFGQHYEAYVREEQATP